ncbi:MAG: TatD family hydrolase [Chthoniobacterales bacterium]
MSLYDAHNHLQAPELTGDLKSVEVAVRELGIEAMVVNGTEEGDWSEVASLAERHEWVRASYGLHPWNVNARSKDWRERLKARWDAGGWVGEIGLDRWKETENFADQMEVFRWQLGEAARRNAPVTIHCLRAWGALTEVIREDRLPERGFLVHAFGGSVEIGRELAGRGAYFSFSGSFLAEERRAKADVYRDLPRERLLVETDAPAMPVPAERCRWGRTGELNHPGNLIVAYEGLAEVLGMPLGELAGRIEENFARFFG